MDKLMKLKAASKDSMRPVEKDAKMSVLKDIASEASKEMGSALPGLKKVSVMAPNKDALKQGLQKAEEMVSGEGSPEEEAQESSAFEKSEPAAHDAQECSPEEMAMSPDELDQKIQALQHLKEEKSQQKGY